MNEYIQIAIAAAFTGPTTWPVAALLVNRQQGNFQFSFLHNLRMSGWKLAFAGCGPYTSYKLFGIGTQRAVQVPVQNYLAEHYSQISASCRFGISGIVSGLIGGFVVTPVEQFKLSLATRGVNSYAEAQKLYLSSLSGLKGLFSGARITIYRNILFDSVNAIVYNSLLLVEPVSFCVPSYISTFAALVSDTASQQLSTEKELILSVNLGNKNNPWTMAGVNAVAGVTTAIIDYPLDVLKTRIQVNTCHRLQNKLQTPNVFSVAKNIVLRDGWRGLYFGLNQKLGLYFFVWAAYGAAYGVVSSALQHASTR